MLSLPPVTSISIILYHLNMKITYYFLLCILLAGTRPVSAQNADYRHVLSTNAGFNFFQLLKFAEFSPTADVYFTSASGYGSPTLQLSYDYGFNNWFSLGLAFASNRFGARYANLVVSGDPIGDLNMKYTRNTFTSRILFHYGNKGRLDMYSGLRLGVSIWDSRPSKTLTATQFQTMADSGTLASERASGKIPHLGLTLFGLRYYATDNIGFGFESAIGSYLACLQINCRFGGDSSGGYSSKSSSKPSSKASSNNKKKKKK